MSEIGTTCEWSIEDADNSAWVTDCGGMFYLAEGTPTENEFNYCCYCGRRLVEAAQTQEEDA